MSSTTNRHREDGQVLVIFAFGLIGILAIAALVFDVGMNLFERRQHQDASDAAALAGARYLVETGCKAAPSNANCPAAVDAAMAIATRHGYAASQVTIHIPPTTHTRFGGFPGHIEVDIASTRGSFFAGVLGMNDFRVGATAVAANIDDYSWPYSFLALGEDCNKDGNLHGNGTMIVEGDVMVSGECTEDTGSLSFDGNRTVVDVQGTCATTDIIEYGPSSTVACGGYAEHVPPLSDPLAGLEGPTIGSGVVPNPYQKVDLVSGGELVDAGPTPMGCRKATDASTAQDATQTNPVGCEIQPKTASSVVRIYPGVYWGGLSLVETNAARQLTVYMEPGIYYMAGGGFVVSGPVDLYTVNPGGTTFGDTGTAGVLIYNTDDPGAGCPASTYPGTPCIKAIDFTGTEGGDIRMLGYPGRVWTSLVFFQDRDASSQPPLKLTGNSTMTISGTIYLPGAAFEFEGNGGSYVLNAQVICKTFEVGGNGDVTVTYTPGDALRLSATGLVQ